LGNQALRCDGAVTFLQKIGDEAPVHRGVGPKADPLAASIRSGKEPFLDEEDLHVSLGE